MLSQVKAKLLHTLFLRAIADFLLEDIICYNKCFKKLIIDKKFENKKVLAELI